jgi:hypothetical protein
VRLGTVWLLGVAAFLTFATVEYVSVSNWNFSDVGHDTTSWRQISYIPLSGKSAELVGLISPVILQPLKTAMDHENRVVSSRIGGAPSVLGRLLARMDTAGKARAFHIGYAVLNSAIWFGVGFALSLWLRGGRHVQVA